MFLQSLTIYFVNLCKEEGFYFHFTKITAEINSVILKMQSVKLEYLMLRSGKTNFLKIFQFLLKIFTELKTANNVQLGIDSLQNFCIQNFLKGNSYTGMRIKIDISKNKCNEN